MIRSRPLVFTIALVALSVVAWVVVAALLQLFGREASAYSMPARIATFDWYAAELALVLSVCLWLVNGGPIARTLAYTVSFAFASINAVQLVSLHHGQSYLSALAIDNIGSLFLILDAGLIAGTSLFCASLFAIGMLIETRVRRKAATRSLATATVALWVLASVLVGAGTWLPDLRARRDDLLSTRHIRHSAPGIAFLGALFPKNPQLHSGDRWQNDLALVRTLGFEFATERPYPLVKEEIYRGSVPFAREEGGPMKPDILVYFIEGLSARTINAYGATHPGLTPNIDRFSEHAMKVENYFSHTAATYRGLHGQLCSIFPYYGGDGGWLELADEIVATRYYCLSHLLGENQYERVFLDSDLKSNEKSFVDEMMYAFDFDRVWSGDELAETFLDGATPLGPKSLSDMQLADALVALLERRANASPNRAPIFTGLYAMGPHAFLDIPPDGSAYGDGTNQALNTIHTADAAFGRFWDHFIQSGLATSTIVILTTDHAHFPDPSFIEIAGDDYKPWFVDRIPLVIYDPTRSLPATFDANHMSSIAFAPSLAHYLGLDQRPTPFVGRSMFDPEERHRGVGAAAVGDDIFFYDREGIHLHGASPHREQEIGALARFIEHLYKVELENRIWPGE